VYVVGGDMEKSKKRRPTRGLMGQGVVEYAGALVIAAGIIAAAIIIVPPNFASFISSVYSTMSTYMMGKIPT
jgi:hypothetical protein